MFRTKRLPACTGALMALICFWPSIGRAAAPAGGSRKVLPPLIRSARSGTWSSPSTWDGRHVPADGARIQIRAGHHVTYDLRSDRAVRSIHVAGTLTFARDRDTRLNVGLIKIQPGADASENGFDCDAHVHALAPSQPRPALEVGTAAQPIPAGHSAQIRLVYFAGMDKASCPAIVCCGGRMEFHGAPMSRTWVKLGATAQVGDAAIQLAEPVTGWRAGDHILVTATEREYQSNQGSRTHRTGKPAAAADRRPLTARDAQKARDALPGVVPEERDDQPLQAFTEERTIQAIQGNRLALNRPLRFLHVGSGSYRGEVANLSRNVIIESADPSGVRGHTMYHRGSAGSISYAEFRHLGKEGVLGRYSIHFHLVGDTMRGSSVIGASIWDSANRWITIHGTNYLVVRDCVGYQSVGHGFYLEDGTEVHNVLDRNLAVQAYNGRPLPNQVFAFDRNQGAGFWWANSLNTFTRNVACECDLYGFRYEATPGTSSDLRRRIRQPDGTVRTVDIRTLPFVRFDGNEAHCVTYGLNLGEDVGGVGPDAQHPFIVKNTRLWNTHWAYVPGTPSVIVDGMEIYDSKYGLYHPVYIRHAYRRLTISQTSIPEDGSAGEKPAGLALPTPDELEAAGRRIRLSGQRPPELDHKYGLTLALVEAQGEIVRYLPQADGLAYGPLASAAFPRPLAPKDDLPPATVITETRQTKERRMIVRGTTSDNGTVKRVLVNGRPARALAPNYAEWEVTFDHVRPGKLLLRAWAEDAAGNVERNAHQMLVTVKR